MMKISVIIPAYNEEATIVELLKRVKAQTVEGFEFEVVIVDDGSQDQTLRLLEENSDLYHHLISLPTNQGKGGAVKAGLKKASGEYVLFQDADLEYDPNDYDTMLYPVREFGADVVMGSRFTAPRYTRVHYFWHKVGNMVITQLFNVLYNRTFSDIYCGYLLYRRNLIEPHRLSSNGWEQHAEILARAVKRAEVIYEVPISYHGRSYKEGKKIRARHVIPIIWMIVKQRVVG